jgi:mono/diheme cytochrome c family protein
MNKPHPMSLAFPMILTWGLTTAAVAEPASDNAQALMTQNCVQCHGAEVYTRKDRKVSSLDGLGRQVRRCEIALELRWFDEDVQAVTDHLNDQFYHFKP